MTVSGPDRAALALWNCVRPLPDKGRIIYTMTIVRRVADDRFAMVIDLLDDR